MGYPGSGKSTLAKNYFTDYFHLSQDEYKTRLMKVTKEKISQKIIIEGVFYSQKQRKVFIDLAKQFNKKIILVKIDIPIELAQHLNKYRGLKTGSSIPIVVYRVYQKRYQEPKWKKVLMKSIQLYQNMITNYSNIICNFFSFYLKKLKIIFSIDSQENLIKTRSLCAVPNQILEMFLIGFQVGIMDLLK